MLETKTLVKICGITSIKQALQVAELGTNAIGIKFKKPRKRFNIATLYNIFVYICSLDSLGLLMKIRINAVKKHNKGLTIEIFILPKAV